MIGAEGLTNEQRQLVEELFLTNRDAFYKKAYSIVGRKADADDAVSAAMLKIIKSIERIEALPRTQLFYFCISIVKNVAIDLSRAKAKESLFALEEEEMTESLDDPEQIAIRKEQIEEIRKLQERLSEEERLLLHLRYGMESEYKEIAVIFGINEESAKKRGQRIIKKLRNMKEAGQRRG